MQSTPPKDPFLQAIRRWQPGPATSGDSQRQPWSHLWMEPGEHSSGTPPVQPSFTLSSDGLIDVAWRRRRKWKGSIRNSRRVGQHVMVMNNDEKRLWVSSVCNWWGLQYAKQTNVWNAGDPARIIRLTQFTITPGYGSLQHLGHNFSTNPELTCCGILKTRLSRHHTVQSWWWKTTDCVRE